jgi:hypothetical protein
LRWAVLRRSYSHFRNSLAPRKARFERLQGLSLAMRTIERRRDLVPLSVRVGLNRPA